MEQQYKARLAEKVKGKQKSSKVSFTIDAKQRETLEQLQKRFSKLAKQPMTYTDVFEMGLDILEDVYLKRVADICMYERTLTVLMCTYIEGVKLTAKHLNHQIPDYEELAKMIEKSVMLKEFLKYVEGNLTQEPERPQPKSDNIVNLAEFWAKKVMDKEIQ